MKAYALVSLACSITAVLNAAPPRKYSYWVEPCTRAGQTCVADDPKLAEWAFGAWQSAGRGAVQFERVHERKDAQIRLFWATAEQGLYGETRPVFVDGKPGAEVYVRPAPFPIDGDQLLRDTIVYLTCLHETGHALGLAHTDVFDDIMYSFQYGGDIPEYVGRYRRKLKTRDDIRRNSGMSEGDRQRLITVLAQ